jgi:hypothetical protein
MSNINPNPPNSEKPPSNLMDLFEFGGEFWGIARFMCGILVLVTILLAFSFLQTQFLDRMTSSSEPSLAQTFSPDSLVPTPIVTYQNMPKNGSGVIIHLQANPFSFKFRYLIIPLGAVLLVFFYAAWYFQDIYELPNFWIALRYLISTCFSISHSKLSIEGGKKGIPPGHINILNEVGGPGVVNIDSNHIALLENIYGPTDIFTPGMHFVPRFFRLTEIISLQDYRISIDSIDSTSKDGIIVFVRDVNIFFRLKRHPQPSVTGSNYNFSDQAVFNMAYGRRVLADERLKWQDAVTVQVVSAIKDLILELTYDQMTSTSTADLTTKVRNKLNSDDFRTQLTNLGAELVQIDIGHFEYEISHKHPTPTWQVMQDYEIDLNQARGEADFIMDQAQGCAEGKAHILQSILDPFSKNPLNGKSTDTVRAIFLARLGHVLDGIVDTPSKPPQPETKIEF